MLTQDSCIFYNAHSVYHNFGGIVFDEQEALRLAESIGMGRGVILQNHGLLTAGTTVDEAVYLFTLMERLCKIQLLAEAASQGGKLEKVLITHEAAQYTHDAGCDAVS